MSNDINIGAISEALNNKMDLDGNNVVASAGASFRNTSNWSNNMTNCITYIPQDINLELNNGTLTIKAGSKVYVPNGSGIFDTVTTNADASTTRTDSNKCMAWYNKGNGSIQVFPIQLFYSGPTAPTQYQYMFWYDTTENKCKVTADSGSTWGENRSFPLCIVSTDGTKISSIDQVFNGFGYIGSTVFALPGVRGLVPNGRNIDGTLRSTEFVIPNVLTDNIDSNWATQYWFYNSTLNKITWYPLRAGEVRYDEYKNFWLDSRQASGKSSFCSFGHTSSNSGKITDFVPKSVFHQIDFSEFLRSMTPDFARAQTVSMPFTATTYGWFIAHAVNVTTTVYVNNVSVAQGNWASGAWSGNLNCQILVSPGDVVTGASGTMRFIPCKGF